MRELKIALKFDPNQTRALATLASLLSQKGEQEKALEVAEHALQVAPKFAILHNNLGLIYRRTDQLELAEKHYKLAIEYNPRHDAAYVNLAQLYRRQGKKEEAIEQFRAAIRASPWHPNAIALANIGVYHFNKDEIPKALAFYVRALQVNPDYAKVHRYVASIYAMPDYLRPNRAIYHLRRTLELDPEQAGADELRQLLLDAENAEASQP